MTERGTWTVLANDYGKHYRRMVGYGWRLIAAVWGERDRDGHRIVRCCWERNREQ